MPHWVGPAAEVCSLIVAVISLWVAIRADRTATKASLAVAQMLVAGNVFGGGDSGGGGGVAGGAGGGGGGGSGATGGDGGSVSG